jgi:Na+-translocating ferredoxin:NAD+ oxidoreductase subunit G
MKQMLKLGFTLAAFAVVSSFLLALVNSITAPVIEQHQIEKANAGMKAVFADADSFEQVADYKPSTDPSIAIGKMYIAKKGGNTVGAVVQVSGPTYDHATILVGIDLKRTITGIQFLELTDSPGFGLKANDPSYKLKNGMTFYEQFKGKNTNDGFIVNKTFDAISGATITSKGVGNLLSQGTYSAGEYLAEKFGGASSSGSVPSAAEQPVIFTFEDAVKDICGEVQLENVAFDSSYYPHSMAIDREAVVRNSDGKIVAAAVEVSGQTYSDNGGSLIAVVDSNRTILGARIVRLQDSPNLGMNTATPSFYNQFTAKSADQNLRPQADYDVVSGASISSDCAADMVKVAAYEAAGIMEKHGGKAAPAGSAEYTLNGHYQEE